MEHRTVEKIAQVAKIWGKEAQVLAPEPRWRMRRRRLLRFADLLEQHKGRLRLFSDMECFPKRDQLALRRSGSPIELALADPEFRKEGLAGDNVGAARSFFELSLGEAHAIFCDCRYAEASGRRGAPGEAVAQRLREIAAKRTLPEIWAGAREAIARWRA
ncbi:MAG TPA: hypothetical protein VED87_02790 [Methylocystis sp.]|nr:hypothetical protein [Methylocystis sp.]